MRTFVSSAFLGSFVLMTSSAATAEPTASAALVSVEVKSEGAAAILYVTRPNASDVSVYGDPQYAICTIPCAARLSTERSYFTLGADSGASRPFRIGPLTTSVVIRQGSGTTRTAGLFAMGLGGVVLGAGLGFGLIYAVANADNNPATAETAGSLAVPSIIGGAVALALGIVLYAVSGTSIRDQAGRPLALRSPTLLPPLR